MAGAAQRPDPARAARTGPNRPERSEPARSAENRSRCAPRRSLSGFPIGPIMVPSWLHFWSNSGSIPVPFWYHSGSILVKFWFHSGSENRSNNGMKNKLILKPGAWGARAFWGPGGDYRGGYLGSVAQISEHQYLSDLVA